MKTVAIVLGTFNRLNSLQRSIASVRAAVGAHPYEIIVVDGGSTDGTREYLAQCFDVKLIRQVGPLTGAVRAFNLGFEAAVERDYHYVMHLNDDAEIITKGTGPGHMIKDAPIADAIDLMEKDATIGEVAFEHDLRGKFNWEYVNGVPYANFGVVRREAGMAVAKAQGDHTGKAWWNPIYRTYGADTEFGVWLWKLGYRVLEGAGLRVHDMNEQDALRAANTGNNKNGDSDLFWSRWRDEDLLQHVKVPTRRQLLEGIAPAKPPVPYQGRRKAGGRPGNCP
jgi:glycosyltransferase involved in cell wall biosynthesis